MTFPWDDARCIICLSDAAPLTDAHIIPKAVGGRLAVKFVCGPCNHRLGHTVEAGLSSDPRVRLAIEALKETLPTLARKMREGRLFIGRDDGVVVRALAKGDGYEVVDSPQEDGSRVKSPARARNEIEETLRRRGEDESTIAKALAKHEGAPEGELVEVAPGLSVRKGGRAGFDLPFTEPLVADECALSIAYLFLAVAVGGAIYVDALEPIRAVLRGEGKNDEWEFESLRADRQYEPWHGLGVEAFAPSLRIQVRLFGENAFRVTFNRLACTGGTFIKSYRVKLDTLEEEWVRGARFPDSAVAD